MWVSIGLSFTNNRCEENSGIKMAIIPSLDHHGFESIVDQPSPSRSRLKQDIQLFFAKALDDNIRLNRAFEFCLDHRLHVRLERQVVQQEEFAPLGKTQELLG